MTYKKYYADPAKHRSIGAQSWADRGYPSMEQLKEWMEEGGAEATDGCWVEPDGVCEHGKESWLLVLGYI